MRQINNNLLILGALMFIVGNNQVVYSQNKSKLRTRLSVDYFNKDGLKYISAKLSSRKDRNFIYPSGQEIQLYHFINEEEILLRNLVTNDNGSVEFELTEEKSLKDDSEGFNNYTVKYIGTEEYKSSSKKIRVKDIVMNMIFTQTMEGKFVELKADEFDTDTEPYPVSDVARGALGVGQHRLEKATGGWPRAGVAGGDQNHPSFAAINSALSVDDPPHQTFF